MNVCNECIPARSVIMNYDTRDVFLPPSNKKNEILYVCLIVLRISFGIKGLISFVTI